MNTQNELVINLPKAPTNPQESINAMAYANSVIEKAINAQQPFGIDIHPEYFANKQFAENIGSKLHNGYTFSTPY